MAELSEQERERWSWKRFLKGPLEPRNYGKVAVYLVCGAVIILLLAGLRAAWLAVFPPPSNGTNTTIGRVEAGGTVKNITIQSARLKQGIYGEVSSVDFGVGVFKEVASNIDISVGIEKDFDDEEVEPKVQARFKF